MNSSRLCYNNWTLRVFCFWRKMCVTFLSFFHWSSQAVFVCLCTCLLFVMCVYFLTVLNPNLRRAVSGMVLSRSVCQPTTAFSHWGGCCFLSYTHKTCLRSRPSHTPHTPAIWSLRNRTRTKILTSPRVPMMYVSEIVEPTKYNLNDSSWNHSKKENVRH